MNDFMDLCLSRQSCRKFTDRPVEREKLARCVEAARQAPSACNSQPWSFVAVETPAVVAKVAECAQQLGANAFLDKARAFIVVLEERAVLMPAVARLIDNRYFVKGDLGAAVLSICLEATSLGLGTCILGTYDRDEMRRLLDIPAEKNFGGLIALGYPESAKIRPKIRKPLEDILRFV